MLPYLRRHATQASHVALTVPNVGHKLRDQSGGYHARTHIDDCGFGIAPAGGL
jgi:hypothetical protein